MGSNSIDAVSMKAFFEHVDWYKRHGKSGKLKDFGEQLSSVLKSRSTGKGKHRYIRVNDAARLVKDCKQGAVVSAPDFQSFFTERAYASELTLAQSQNWTDSIDESKGSYAMRALWQIMEDWKAETSREYEVPEQGNTAVEYAGTSNNDEWEVLPDAKPAAVQYRTHQYGGEVIQL